MENRLAHDNLPRLLLSLAVPAMLAQVITLGYNLVDRIYIGHMDDGASAMTAIGICMPIVTIITAAACLFGRGGAPLSGISMGAGRQDEADRILSNSLSLLILSSLLITIGILLFCEPLLLLFGASSATLPYAEDYLRIYSLGVFFFQISLGLNFFINTQGFTRIGMMTPLIGCVINIVLDPIFIFALDLGIRGAAIATVIAQFVSFLWVLRFYRSPLAQLHARVPMMRPRAALVRRIMMLGASPAFMISTEGILLLSFNTQLARFGGDIAVGSMAILASIFQLVLLPMIGIYQGAQPIVSYNYGAGNHARVRETIWLAGCATLAYSLICTCLLTAFPHFVAGLFTPDQGLVGQTAPMLRLYICGCLFLGMTIVSQDTYNALGDGKLSLFFAFFRKGMLLIPLIYIFPCFAEDKVFAVIAAEPVSDIAASLASTAYFVHYVKKKLPVRSSGSRDSAAVKHERGGKCHAG
ncbi:MAG: MATE family efflux transporter [Desulfovibrionaceae bacterium]|nr:MATE family efflux transporter [Desulfovibrionaceae bacterium]